MAAITTILSRGQGRRDQTFVTFPTESDRSHRLHQMESANREFGLIVYSDYFETCCPYLSPFSQKVQINNNGQELSVATNAHTVLCHSYEEQPFLSCSGCSVLSPTEIPHAPSILYDRKPSDPEQHVNGRRRDGVRSHDEDVCQPMSNSSEFID